MGVSTIFSGNSRFAYDFQAIIDRSVAIASLPLKQMNSVKSTLTAQAAALDELETKFAGLEDSLGALGNSAGLGSFSASVSDESVLRATLGVGVMEGAFTVEVDSIGAYTNAVSLDGLTTVSDPYSQNISSAPSFTLTINGESREITPDSDTLAGLVTAINQIAGEDVRASIVNIGSSWAPDYRLSIRGTRLAADAISFSDGSTELVETLVTGANAEYRLNGMARVIQSESRTVTLAPGLTVELRDETADGQPVTVAVGREISALLDAMTAFVNSYNSVVEELDRHRGSAAGPLVGQSVLYSLTNSLRRLGTYADGLSSLRAIGVEVDQFGSLSLDSAKLEQAGAETVAAFLGSSGGGGFLEAAEAELALIDDPDNGHLSRAVRDFDDQIRRQEDRIEAEEGRISLMQENLQARIAAADALIASLEQQAEYFNGLFEAMRISRESM